MSNSLETVPASGGAGTLTITAARDCTWAASNGAAWIAIISPSNGQGDGSITYRVASNNEPTPRRANIDVNNTGAAITQEAAACRYTVAPAATTVGASGGSMAVQVQANAACGWTAASEAGWIRIASGASGQGDGSVALAVDANSGPPRSARVTVAGSIVTVDQASDIQAPVPPTCAYSIQPVGQTIAAAGGTGTIDVTANVATCAWTAAANAGWITITGGASGSGNGRVTFNVSANDGASRTGAIGVAGQTFTLTQAGASCSYSISPSNAAMAAGGGPTSVNVSTGGSCAWTSAANVSWITVTSGGSGAGPGTVSLNVGSNVGEARSGTATIAAQAFTVTQAGAPCTVVLSPSSIDIPAAGGDGTTTITAGGGCAWNATSNASWITITSAASGTGNGSIRFSAAANGGPARSGTLTIGGQTLTVTQQPVACTYVIAPTSQTMVAGGGAGSVNVTAGGSCGWTATSNNADWLTLTSAAGGTGNGTVSFSAAPNPGALRTGTLTIAGQTFTLTQEAPCTYAIDPQSQTMTAAGGTGTVTVTAAASCSWTAVSSHPEWLTVSAGTPGAGNGQITFSAATNTLGVDRSATITIAGLSFTLMQTAQ